MLFPALHIQARAVLLGTEELAGTLAHILARLVQQVPAGIPGPHILVLPHILALPADTLGLMADILALMADIPALLADIPALIHIRNHKAGTPGQVGTPALSRTPATAGILAPTCTLQLEALLRTPEDCSERKLWEKYTFWCL